MNKLNSSLVNSYNCLGCNETFILKWTPTGKPILDMVDANFVRKWQWVVETHIAGCWGVEYVR